MKMMMLIGTMILCMTAEAATYNCFGVGENKGARAKMELNTSRGAGKYTFVGSIFDMKKPFDNVACAGVFDKTYKPRTADPKQDRYSAGSLEDGRKTCGAENVWMEKTLVANKKGFVNLVFAGGHPGDFSSFDFLCVEN